MLLVDISGKNKALEMKLQLVNLTAQCTFEKQGAVTEWLCDDSKPPPGGWSAWPKDLYTAKVLEAEGIYAAGWADQSKFATRAASAALVVSAAVRGGGLPHNGLSHTPCLQTLYEQVLAEPAPRAARATKEEVKEEAPEQRAPREAARAEARRDDAARAMDELAAAGARFEDLARRFEELQLAKGSAEQRCRSMRVAEQATRTELEQAEEVAQWERGEKETAEARCRALQEETAKERRAHEEQQAKVRAERDVQERAAVKQVDDLRKREQELQAENSELREAKRQAESMATFQVMRAKTAAAVSEIQQRKATEKRLLSEEELQRARTEVTELRVELAASRSEANMLKGALRCHERGELALRSRKHYVEERKA